MREQAHLTASQRAALGVELGAPVYVERGDGFPVTTAYVRDALDTGADNQDAAAYAHVTDEGGPDDQMPDLVPIAAIVPVRSCTVCGEYAAIRCDVCAGCAEAEDAVTADAWRVTTHRHVDGPYTDLTVYGRWEDALDAASALTGNFMRGDDQTRFMQDDAGLVQLARLDAGRICDHVGHDPTHLACDVDCPAFAGGRGCLCPECAPELHVTRRTA